MYVPIDYVPDLLETNTNVPVSRVVRLQHLAPESHPRAV